MSNPYRRYTSFYQDISNSQAVAAGTGDTTLVTAKANHTIHIQKVHIEITTGSAGKTWTFEDSAATPVVIVSAVDAASVAHFDFDFGPKGVPLTEAKNFVLNVSAAGAVGWVTWEGYQKLTAVASA